MEKDFDIKPISPEDLMAIDFNEEENMFSNINLCALCSHTQGTPTTN